jgi:hypothetical protein
LWITALCGRTRCTRRGVRVLKALFRSACPTDAVTFPPARASRSLSALILTIIDLSREKWNDPLSLSQKFYQYVTRRGRIERGCRIVRTWCESGIRAYCPKHPFPFSLYRSFDRPSANWCSQLMFQPILLAGRRR